uniref:RNA polymerase Rpb4/RPC9 core domain-containing protein n=1 Tax=Oryctolagus cuniculus TaxID=9986 RepID=A0A5F9CFC6_RABIT
MWETWKKLLASDRLSSSHCSHLGSEPVMEDLSVSLPLPAFGTAETLPSSAAHALPERPGASRAQDKSSGLTYTAHFNRFKADPTAGVHSLLLQKKPHGSELAGLANLCPGTAGESKALIPSLEGPSEDKELQQILDDVQTRRGLQY